MSRTSPRPGLPCLHIGYNRLVDGSTLPRPKRQSPPLAFDAPPAEIIERLLSILRQADACRTLELDLALVRAIQARDYITSAGGASLRNVMSISQAIVGGHLRLGSIHQQEDFSALIEGRRFIAIAHGEGDGAQLTLIENDRWDDHIDDTPMVWQDLRRTHRLLPGSLRALFESPHDRIILGPHVLYRSRNVTAGPAYHEIQSGKDSALHAINALQGETCVTRAGFQAWLIEQRAQAGAEEDRFYINPAPRDPVMPFYAIDGLAAPAIMADLMRQHLPGKIEASPAGTPPEDLITLAQSWERRKDGIIVFVRQRYVAFKKVLNPYDRVDTWILIDSDKHHQVACWPSHHLRDLSSLEGCVLFGWSANGRMDALLNACSVQ